MKKRDADLEHAVIEFYREEIRRRYQLEKIRECAPFDEIPDARIDGLRDFFLDSMYPANEDRETLDQAFEELYKLLKSPRRLAPLMKLALASAWRLGAQLPAAVSAGLITVDSLRKTRRLESHMMNKARQLGLSAEDAHDRAKMVQVLAQVPDRAVKDLIRDVLAFFKTLTNVKMLSAMTEIMARSKEVMEERSDLYRQEECDGVALGLRTVEDGLALFKQLRKKDFPNILEGIEMIELDWYDRLCKEAAATAGEES